MAQGRIRRMAQWARETKRSARERYRLEAKWREIYRLRGIYCQNLPRTMSALEDLVCNALCRWSIVHEHFPEMFPVTLEDGTRITYRPDFRVGDVYLEPHGSVDDPRFIAKMKAFRREYPEKTVVLISSAFEILRTPPEIFTALVPSQDVSKLKPLLQGFFQSVGQLHELRQQVRPLPTDR